MHIRMFDPETGKTGDIHPLEVDNMKKFGWKVKEEPKVAGTPKVTPPPPVTAPVPPPPVATATTERPTLKLRGK